MHICICTHGQLTGCSGLQARMLPTYFWQDYQNMGVLTLSNHCTWCSTVHTKFVGTLRKVRPSVHCVFHSWSTGQDRDILDKPTSTYKVPSHWGVAGCEGLMALITSGLYTRVTKDDTTIYFGLYLTCACTEVVWHSLVARTLSLYCYVQGQSETLLAVRRHVLPVTILALSAAAAHVCRMDTVMGTIIQQRCLGQ